MPPTERPADGDRGRAGGTDGEPLRTAQRSAGRFLAFLAREPWWAFLLVSLGPVLYLCFRWRFVGVENLPESGPVIVASNHVSPIDPFAIGLATVIRRRRSIRYLTAAEFFDPPLNGFVLPRIGMIPIRRGGSDIGALSAAIEALSGGAVVGIFPEGGLGDGVTLERGHSGVARLALEARVPVVPVAVWGTQRRWPRSGLHRRRPLRPTVAVAFGAPIHTHANGQSSRPKDVRALTDEVMAAIAAALDAARAAG